MIYLRRHTFSEENLAGTDINSSSEFIISYALKITVIRITLNIFIKTEKKTDLIGMSITK